MTIVLGSTFSEWIRQSSFLGGIAVTILLVAVLVLAQLELLGTGAHRATRINRTLGLRRRRISDRRRGVAITASLCSVPLLVLFVVIVVARFAVLT